MDRQHFSKSMTCIPTNKSDFLKSFGEKKETRASLMDRCRNMLKNQKKTTNRRNSLAELARKAVKKIRSTSFDPRGSTNDPEALSLYFNPKFWESTLLGQYVDMNDLKKQHEDWDEIESLDGPNN